jgi:tetratricopeptide (TPR) repeat protein
MILGPGGIGKSSLAARAVEQSEEHFHAVLSIGCKSVPTAEQILLELNTFLTLNGNKMFDQVMEAPLDIAQKIEYLPQALNASRYLIIFDNFEDMLDPTREQHVVKDEQVRYLLETLTTNLRESRVMITSRLDFLFTRDSRYQGNILSVLLSDLTIMEAFRLIANMPALCNTTDEEKLLIYEKAGGSPYIIDLVSNAAKDVPIGNVLLDIKELQKEFAESMLLNKLYEWLPDAATKRFFRCVSVYRKPVNQDFLAAMGGNDERIGYMLHKSLLNRIAANMYEMHTNTRSFAFELHEQIDGASGLKESQITAAEMYLNAGTEEGYADEFLESRWFFYSAGEYNKAGELVHNLTEPLYRWGFINLVRELNEETVESATGVLKADALHHLGLIHQDQGRYEEAEKMYQASLKIEEELGDKSGIASNLHHLGMIHQGQGRYEEAEKMYQDSLKINEEQGNKRGIAYTLGQLGTIHLDKGKYEEAIELYQQVKHLSEELGDKRSIAITLHNMGLIHEQQGRYEDAAKMYQDSLKIKEELGDKSGIASTLHQLGNVHYVQDQYEEAEKMYQDSLKIEEELGNKRGIAYTLGQMGTIYHDQGRYEEAIELYQQVKHLSEELGDKRSIALSLYKMGMSFHTQRNYREALKNLLVAFNIFSELNSPYKDLAKQLISKLKEEIGDALFNRYNEEITANE